MSERKNISISGMASLKGGTYGNVSISGSGKVNGDMDVEKMSVSGTVSIDGNLDANKINISGNSKVNGYVKSDEIVLAGAFKCTSKVECEIFNCNGTFDVRDMLNAESIKVEVSGRCSVSEIGCQSIQVKKGSSKGFLKGIFGNKKVGISDPKLVVDIIEGDDIEVENIIAKIVRGKNVTIGEGCDIQVVEYMENISINDKSNIREKNKI